MCPWTAKAFRKGEHGVSLARQIPQPRAAERTPVDYRFGVDNGRALARDTPGIRVRHTGQGRRHTERESTTRREGLGEGGQGGVHHDPHAQRQRALVEVEVGVVQLLLRALAGPDAEPAH